MKFTLARLAPFQRAAARSTEYHDKDLVEAILHHCALMVASCTAPTDAATRRYVDAEIKQFHKLLRMPVQDLEGIAVRGRYIRAYLAIDPECLEDTGTPEALIAGLAGAA